MNKLNKQPYYDLNINIDNAVRQDFDYRSFVNRTGNFNLRVFNYDDVKNIFNESWIDYMHDLGFMVTYGIIFARDPNFDDWQHAHIDTIPDYSVITDDDSPRPIVNYAVNWTLSPQDDAEMIWYQNNTEVADATIISGKEINASNFTETHRHVIGSTPTLVNTGVFHSVVGGSNNRYAISLRSMLPGVSAVCDWQTAVEHFNPYVIK